MRDYRGHGLSEARTEPLHPLLTDMIQVLIDQRLQAERVPKFWDGHADKHGLEQKRRLHPSFWRLARGLVFTVAPLIPLYCWLRGLCGLPAVFAWFTVLALIPAVRFPLEIRFPSEGEPEKRREDLLRWMSVYVPFFNLYCGAKEAIAAAILSIRNERPNDDAMLYAILKDGEEKILAPMRARQKDIEIRHGSDDHPLVVAAAMAVTQCERAFRDYDEALTKMNPTGLYAVLEEYPQLRESLCTHFLLAQGALEAAEQGPTEIRADNGETAIEVTPLNVLARAALYKR